MRAITLNEEGEFVQKVKLGLEVFLESGEKFHAKRVAVLTNTSGIDRNLRWNVDSFVENGLNLVKLFSPEHGVWGSIAEGQEVSNDIILRYKLPVISLFGKAKKPTAEQLKNVDVLVYDIQDVGLRFYTYIYTLAYIMQACAENGVKVVVLDRPNPLSGQIEGPLIDEKFSSFVGGYGLALRYGMTVGELARYFNEEWKMNVNLEIVKMQNWKRSYYYDELDLPWPTPSPNLPSMEHTILYAGTCLFEGVNVSVGRGTVHPFKYVGAPWIDSYELKNSLEKIEHPGVSIREVHFVPSASKYKNELCHGLEFFLAEREKFQSIEFVVEVIKAIKTLNVKRFRWEKFGNRYHFDLLIGSDKYRKAIEERREIHKLIKIRKKEGLLFEKKIQKYLIYD